MSGCFWACWDSGGGGDDDSRNGGYPRIVNAQDVINIKYYIISIENIKFLKQHKTIAL